MSKKISFDELLAKREQREADKLKIGMLTLPNSDRGLEARMPPKAVVMELYGEMASAENAEAILACGNHALYACCPQLQDPVLHERLGVDADPIMAVDVLFSVTEQDSLGGQALKFLGLLPQDPKPGEEKNPENQARDTVKN